MVEKLTTNDTLYQLMQQELIRKIKSGEATAADLNVARQLLKDVNYMPTPEVNEGAAELKDALPFDPNAVDTYAA